MKSPRFDMRAKSLRLIFAPANIQRVWKEKIRISVRDQFLSDGIEHTDFYVDHPAECANVSKLVLSGDYVPSRPQRILVEKGKGLCRQLVIPSVRDAIVLQCLSDALYSQIRGKAPTSQAFFEIKDHRFSSDRTEYGTFASWLNFQKALLQFQKVKKFVVVTDIANYYDSISYEHLRNVVASFTFADEAVLDMLIFVLSNLLWQPDYSPRIEIGLPQMDFDAPRILAHCFLYELDSYMSSRVGTEFVRFMDDVDFGVDSTAEAKRILREVDLVLQTRQLRLNSGKTQILSAAQAEHHFRVTENKLINNIANAIENKAVSGVRLKKIRRQIVRQFNSGMRRKSFDGGAGDKILKRLITLAGKTSSGLSRRQVKKIILFRPSVRESAIKYLVRGGLTEGKARLLRECMESGHLIDDASFVYIANGLVSALAKSKAADGEIRAIISAMPDTMFGIYGRLWLKSKYFGALELVDEVERSLKLWAPHERLGRVIGGIYATVPSESRGRYQAIASRAKNAGADSVMMFLRKLEAEPATFRAVAPLLRSPNPSKGTGITHGKFFCLASSLRNNSVNQNAKDALLRSNARLFQDAYYKRILLRAK